MGWHETPERRLTKQIDKDPVTACWNWLGALCKGYGQLGCKVDGLPSYWHQAHRLSYHVFVGRVPDGMFVCHKCNNRRCINPEHLYAGTRLDNARDRRLALGGQQA